MVSNKCGRVVIILPDNHPLNLNLYNLQAEIKKKRLIKI